MLTLLIRSISNLKIILLSPPSAKYMELSILLLIIIREVIQLFPILKTLITKIIKRKVKKQHKKN